MAKYHQFKCPHCGQSLGAESELFGEDMQCPSCHDSITVPNPTIPLPIPSYPKRVISGLRSKIETWMAAHYLIISAFIIIIGVIFVFKFSGINFNMQTIHEAAKNGKIAAIEKHLREGVDINVKDENGATPLIWAVPSGRLDLVEYLIDKGADVNARANRGVTPLGLAVMIGNLEIVKLLVKKGADVNARDDASIGIDGKYYNGMTPLGMALEYRNIQPYNNIANFLEQHGARE